MKKTVFPEGFHCRIIAEGWYLLTVPGYMEPYLGPADFGDAETATEQAKRHADIIKTILDNTLDPKAHSTWLVGSIKQKLAVMKEVEERNRELALARR